MLKSFITCVLFLFSALSAQAQNFQFVEATIDDIHASLKSGEMSCREIVTGYIERINYYDQDTKLNAITVINQNALAKADAIDVKLKNG